VKGHLDLRSVDFTYPSRPNIPVLRGSAALVVAACGRRGREEKAWVGFLWAEPYVGLGLFFSLLFIFIFFSFVLLLFFPVAVAGEAAAVAVREAVWPGPSSAAERAARPSKYYIVLEIKHSFNVFFFFRCDLCGKKLAESFHWSTNL